LQAVAKVVIGVKIPLIGIAAGAKLFESEGYGSGASIVVIDNVMRVGRHAKPISP
jgi:hypothetical protein